MAITFSGFNDIDFSAVADAIIEYERQPLTQLQTKKTALETQNTAFSSLAGKLTTLRSAFQALGDESSMAGLAVSSSDAGVGVTTTSGNIEGSYEVVVSQLARRQVTSSTSTYGATTDEIASGGTLVLRDGAGNDTVITVTGPLTVRELADAINAKEGAPVSASVVQTSPGVYQLVFTGRSTGAANGFSVITSGLTGGAGLAFTDTDLDGISGDSPGDNTQSASNASLTINGLAISSASNVVSDAVPGVTLNLQKEDAAKTVLVDVTRNHTAGTERLDKLVAAYNDLVTFLDAQRNSEIAGRAGISRDPLVRSLRDSLRSGFMGEYSGGGQFSRLAEVGLGFDRSGKLTLDKTIYEAKMKDTPGDVQALFSAAGGTGAFGALKSTIETYTESGGLVADMRERLTEQAKKMTARMDAMEAQLQQRRLALMAQYNAADQTMTRLKNQASTLSTLSSTYRLF